MKRYLIAALIFVVYLALVIFLGYELHFEGTKFALFIILLALVGAIAIAAVLWYLAKSSPPASSGELNATESASLDALLRDADRKLRSAPQSGGKSLASMPLIYVIGDENSAKTQTILQSGLDPELLAGQLHRDGILAPTQMANLWLAGSSVIVEAGGALLRQPALWHRLIRATQPGRLGSVFGKGAQPTRAVVLCVSVERLLAPNTSDQVRALAQTLNERLRQLSQTLGISLPIYVLFTKLDTVPAFAEYAGHLTPDEVKLPLGSLLATLPAGAGLYAERASTQVAARFDELVYSLSEFRLEVLSRGGELPALARAYEFPRDLRKLRAAIVDFLVELARPSQLGVNPFLRGFFFTGMRAMLVDENLAAAAAQPQQPILSADAGATRAFSLAAMQQQYQAPQPQRGARKVPQWVFLPYLFSRFLLTDKAALETSRSSTKVSLLKRALLAFLCGCFLLYLLLITISFFNNHSLETRVTTAAAASVSHPQQGQLATVSDLQTLDQLGQIVRELDGYRKDGAPIMDRWGLWSGDTLYPLACHAWSAKFRTLLLTPTQINILTALRAVQSPPTPDADYNATYKPLKAYLITTSNPEKSTVDFLSPVLMSAWAGTAQPGSDLSRLAQTQFDLYAAILAEPQSCLAPTGGRPDLTTVYHTRDYLNGFSGFQHVYQSMLTAANHKSPAVSYNDKFPGSSHFIVDAYPVQGAFTKPGFAFMQDAIQHPDPYFSGEEWVLGRQSSGNIDRSTLPALLQKQYITDYLTTWRTYLTTAHFIPYTNMADAGSKLSALDSNVSPMLELFSLLSINTGVSLPDIATAFQAPQSVVPSTNPPDRFTAAPNQPYIQALQGLEQAIKQVSLNPLSANDPASAAIIIQAASQADQAAETLRNTFNPDPDGKMDSTSFALLEAPIKSANALAAHAPAAAAGGGAKSFCDQANPVLAKFPFNPQSTTDASPEEVALIFSPGQGALATLYTKSLSQLLVLQGSNYVPTPGSTVGISPNFLSFFNAAEKVSSTLFPGGGTQPTLTFTLAEPKVASTPNASLNIDGQQLNAGQTAVFHWIAQPASKITLTSEQNSAPTMTGPWSVFHLAFTANHPAPNILEYAFQFNGHTNQTVRFTADGPGAPLLDPKFMGRLRCVATVAK
jgi:type VI secretion system protein ImpL